MTREGRGDLADKAPHLLYAGQLSYRADELFHKSVHKHPEWTEFLLITEGEGEYLIGGTRYSVRPQSLVVYNPGVWHEERSFPCSAHRMMYIGCSSVQISGLPPGDFLASDVPPVIPLRHRYLSIKEKFYELWMEYVHPGPESNYICDHLLAVLLAEVMRELHHRPAMQRRPSAANAVSVAKQFIHENYPANLRLAEVSAAAFLSPFHLSHVFKQQTGQSPMQYLRAYRIEVAKKYLLTTDHTVGTIAGMVGYQSETHFINLFQRQVGVSPGRFRQTAIGAL
ncbi:AraC family transcriptional regulator [Alicyclobacillus cycloheptanicus]|uniref:AraC-like DNA-binding protein n=1 Tax=Alicyclobacillus cycloheptanicus TaxID=1457 RepID=A0ABT9XHV5_9BACL|nr:AraC family transcriptional regulator [Alicyclobacillus cycloheptanicus]MDQ0189894.1 AraC-like DNA-binding protein [Alicyclobacillus cycloheptanicus]WDM02202.1 AraC family transcriptional regulator [Alicyclobacillus cycloheptanicus]